MAVFMKTKTPKSATLPAATNPPTPREAAARLAAESTAQANQIAAERAGLEQQQAALGRKRAGLADLLGRSQQRYEELMQQATDASLLAEIGLAPEQPDRAELAGLLEQVDALHGELDKVDATHADLARRIAALRVQEQDLRQRAIDAPLAVLQQERQALVAAARTHRVRYLLTLRKAGRWNRDNDLLGFDAAGLLHTQVKPIHVEDTTVAPLQDARLLAPYLQQDLRWLDEAAAELGIAIE